MTHGIMPRLVFGFMPQDELPFCSATSSALWSPTQVAFHGSSFAGPLPSAAPVTDGNEDVWVFYEWPHFGKTSRNMPWSRVCVCVCVCVCVFLLFSLPTRGKTKFLKDFCWVLPHSLKGSRLNWLCVELLILESSLQALYRLKKDCKVMNEAMKMNKVHSDHVVQLLKCSHVLFRKNYSVQLLLKWILNPKIVTIYS